jgi:AraC-like DNA-binding protein
MIAGDGYDVRSLACTYRDGHRLGGHTHPWAQLVYATSGVMHVTAEGRLWFVPPTRAVWIPPGVRHEILVRGEVAMRTLYVSAGRAGALRPLAALEVAPLLSALITHIVALGMLDPAQPDHDRLAGVLMDLVGAARAIDLMVPLPVDPRALKLAALLRTQPADRRDLDALAAECGASLRTLQRLFADEAGLTIEAWRQKARLAHAAAMLARRAPVTEAALDSGYDSVSAFIHAFRRQFGVTPGAFAKRACG